jgi:hypothetical protein
VLVIELNKLNLLLGFVRAKDDVEINLPRLGCEKVTWLHYVINVTGVLITGYMASGVK